MERSNKCIKSAPKRTFTNEEKEFRRNLYVTFFGMLLFGSCFIYYKYSDNQLKNEATRTKGILIGIIPGGKSGPDAQFMFWVNGEKRISTGAYFPQYDNFEYGDTCFVIYTRSNPDNCKLEQIEVNGHKQIRIKRRVGR